MTKSEAPTSTATTAAAISTTDLTVRDVMYDANVSPRHYDTEAIATALVEHYGDAVYAPEADVFWTIAAQHKN